MDEGLMGADQMDEDRLSEDRLSETERFYTPFEYF